MCCLGGHWLLWLPCAGRHRWVAQVVGGLLEIHHLDFPCCYYLSYKVISVARMLSISSTAGSSLFAAHPPLSCLQHALDSCPSIRSSCARSKPAQVGWLSLGGTLCMMATVGIALLKILMLPANSLPLAGAEEQQGEAGSSARLGLVAFMDVVFAYGGAANWMR
jgi:hypothetical protein